MDHATDLTQTIFSGLYAELTWHTLIEVVAIIITAIIVHPIVRFAGKQLEKLSQRSFLQNDSRMS